MICFGQKSFRLLSAPSRMKQAEHQIRHIVLQVKTCKLTGNVAVGVAQQPLPPITWKKPELQQ